MKENLKLKILNLVKIVLQLNKMKKFSNMMLSINVGYVIILLNLSTKSKQKMNVVDEWLLQVQKPSYVQIYPLENVVNP